jgi:hypothetical protein
MFPSSSPPPFFGGVEQAYWWIILVETKLTVSMSQCVVLVKPWSLRGNPTLEIDRVSNIKNSVLVSVTVPLKNSPGGWLPN